VARRWVAVRAVELGWSKEKHEPIERNTGHGSRRDHPIERIGKKYQWIAYWQLIGYLIDHHWYLDYDEPPCVLDRIDPFDALDIDASFLPRQNNEEIPAVRVPPMALPETDYQGTEGKADYAWTATLDDLPDIRTLVEKRDDSGNRWWLVKAYRKDTGYLDKLESEGPMRTGQYWIDLIVIKKSDIDVLFARIKDTSLYNSDLFDRAHGISTWVGEHSAEFVAASSKNWPMESEHGGLNFDHITMAIDPNRGEFDQSGTVGQFQIPTRSLLRALNLRPEGPWSPGFVTPAGVLVFLDTSVTGEHDDPVLVNAELLAPALENEGLLAAWVFGAEKDGGQRSGKGGQYNSQTDRRLITGLWWQNANGWRGATWLAPKDPM
jgi:hypothetical protein